MRRLILLSAAAAWLTAAPRPGAFSRGYDVERYRIELHFDEATHSFQGTTRIALLPLKDGFEACELDAETFRVTSVRDDQGELPFEQPTGKLTVHLRRPHRRLERAVFTVAYEARNVSVDPVKYGMMQSYGSVKLTDRGRVARQGTHVTLPSVPTHRRLPGGEGSLSEESIVGCLQVMTSHSEQVVNRHVDREESLYLGWRFEATHLAFLLQGVLVRHLDPVVLTLAGPMVDEGKDLSVHRRVGSQFVGNELQRRSPLAL